MRLEKVKQFGQSLRVSKQSQDLNPGICDPTAQAHNHCAVLQSFCCTFHAKTPTIHLLLQIKKENENQGEGESGHCDKYNQLMYLALPGSQGRVSSISRFCAETRVFPQTELSDNYIIAAEGSALYGLNVLLQADFVSALQPVLPQRVEILTQLRQSGPFRRSKSVKADSSISDSKTWQTSNCSLEFEAKWNKTLFANFSYVYCPSQIAKC